MAERPPAADSRDIFTVRLPRILLKRYSTQPLLSMLHGITVRGGVRNETIRIPLDPWSYEVKGPDVGEVEGLCPSLGFDALENPTSAGLALVGFSIALAFVLGSPHGRESRSDNHMSSLGTGRTTFAPLRPNAKRGELRGLVGTGGDMSCVTI